MWHHLPEQQRDFRIRSEGCDGNLFWRKNFLNFFDFFELKLKKVREIHSKIGFNGSAVKRWILQCKTFLVLHLKPSFYLRRPAYRNDSSVLHWTKLMHTHPTIHIIIALYRITNGIAALSIKYSQYFRLQFFCKQNESTNFYNISPLEWPTRAMKIIFCLNIL